MSLCKLCGEKPASVASHIIPAAFFRELRNPGGVAPILVTRAPGHPPRRAPIGVYDEGILCDDCELQFQDVDDYGTNVLLKEFETRFERKEAAPGLAFYTSTSIDPDKLLQFKHQTWPPSLPSLTDCPGAPAPTDCAPRAVADPRLSIALLGRGSLALAALHRFPDCVGRFDCSEDSVQLWAARELSLWQNDVGMRPQLKLLQRAVEWREVHLYHRHHPAKIEADALTAAERFRERSKDRRGQRLGRWRCFPAVQQGRELTWLRVVGRSDHGQRRAFKLA